MTAKASCSCCSSLAGLEPLEKSGTCSAAVDIPAFLLLTLLLTLIVLRLDIEEWSRCVIYMQSLCSVTTDLICSVICQNLTKAFDYISTMLPCLVMHVLRNSVLINHHLLLCSPGSGWCGRRPGWGLRWRGRRWTWRVVRAGRAENEGERRRVPPQPFQPVTINTFTSPVDLPCPVNIYTSPLTASRSVSRPDSQPAR